jgi:hypothetical protein
VRWDGDGDGKRDGMGRGKSDGGCVGYGEKERGG